MSTHLVALTTHFIDVRAFYHRVGTAASRQRHRAGHARAGANCRIDNLFC